MFGYATRGAATHTKVGRRHVLYAALSIVLLSRVGGLAHAASRRERRLSLYNPRTDERFDDIYWREGNYVPASLTRINWLMRDFRCDAVAPIDADLLELLHRIGATLETKGSFEILSGFRTPATNRLLRHEGRHAAAHSEHLFGKAADIRVNDVRLEHLYRAALSLKAGGVGTYWRDDFVHVDVGPVRSW